MRIPAPEGMVGYPKIGLAGVRPPTSLGNLSTWRDKDGRYWQNVDGIWRRMGFRFLNVGAGAGTTSKSINTTGWGIEANDVLVLWVTMYNLSGITYPSGGFTTAAEWDAHTGDYAAMRYKICTGSETEGVWNPNTWSGSGAAACIAHFRPEDPASTPAYTAQAHTTQGMYAQALTGVSVGDLVVTCWGGWNNVGNIGNADTPPYMCGGAYASGSSAFIAWQTSLHGGRHGVYYPTSYGGSWFMSGQMRFTP